MSPQGPPNMESLLAQAQQMQGRLAALQRDLATRRFEGSAGGGMVIAIASGELRVIEIEIEPELVAGGDRQMIQDLCVAAVNAALVNAQQGAQEEMRRLSGALGIPGLGGPGFGGS